LGAKELLHLFGTRRLRELMANIFLTKRDIDNRLRTLKNMERSPTLSQNFTNFGTNGLKSDENFYSPSLFCSVSVYPIPSKRH